MQENKRSRHDATIDDVMPQVMPYLHDAKDRYAASLVCRRWYQVDSETRVHITIAFCYTTCPDMLKRRFPNLNSLKLKGKPRAAMFNLIPEDWGGYATPWINEIAASLKYLNVCHFRRMIISDSDLEVLARARTDKLEVLKLDKCSGFSTTGLLHITRHCRKLKTLFLEESGILENDGEWLHELALNNTTLEILNFYMTDLLKVSSKDLELIATNCHSLVSVKISDFEILELLGFFGAATALEEFGGGSFNDEPGNPEKYTALAFHPRLCRLGLSYMGRSEMQLVFPYASQLKKLDLLYAMLDTEDHCVLIQRCPNLEVLETRNVIGDRGLDILAQTCPRLQRLRIERGADDVEMEDEGGLVTQLGLMSLAEGCPRLEYMAIYVSNITNEALEYMGANLVNLRDFRLVLLDREEKIADLPLDLGVRALLRGCVHMRRFALYLRPGGLTNLGLRYVGENSPNVRWMLLGYVGDSDEGILEFSRGCPNLQKLEMRGCIFSQRGIALAARQLDSLRYLWVQGYRGSQSGNDLLLMARPFWNIELIPARRVVVTDQLGVSGVLEHPAHILAYYSLVGPRRDFPQSRSVIPLEAAPPAIYE